MEEVLECWPLELVIRTDSGEIERVTLAEDCQVSRQSERVSAGEIKVGSEVTCQLAEPDRVVSVIEID